MKKLLLILLCLPMIGFASFPINTFDEECDNLILRDGNEILVKIIEITPDLIKYKRCKKEDGPLISVSKEDVFMIKYNDGTKELIELSKDNSRDRNIRTHTKKDRKGYIGITYGISYPIGDYVSTFKVYDDAILTNRGVSIGLVNFYYKFNKNIGIAANWYGIANPTEIQPNMTSDFRMDYPSVSFDIISGVWAVGGLSGGLLISFPSNNLDFDLKALIGFAGATSPQFDITATDGLSTLYTSTIAINSNTSVSFSFGSGVRYHISERWALNLNLDYFTTKVGFQEGYYTTNSNEVTFLMPYFEQRISVLNLSIGIGYRL